MKLAALSDANYRRAVVAQEPIPAGKVGRVMVSGVTPVRLDKRADWHSFATIDPNLWNAAELISAPFGMFRILHSYGSGGVDWSIVELHSTIAGGLWGKATQNWLNNPGNGSYVPVNPCDDRNGSNVDTSTEIYVYLPRNGLEYDPNIIADSIIPFDIVNAGIDPFEGVCTGFYLDGKIDESHALILNGGTVPEGWEKVADADQKTVAFNMLPPRSGFHEHGPAENNHDDHPSHPVPSVGDIDIDVTVNGDVSIPCGSVQEGDKSYASVGGCGTFPISATGNATSSGEITGWNGSHPSHTDTSNWPPYHMLDLIKRIDNSA